MYQYVLLEKIQYEGTWILGVVSSLNEALEYFSINIKNSKNEHEESNGENLDWGDYVSYWVEEWDKTKRLHTYKFNTRSCLLEKQKPRRGELD